MAEEDEEQSDADRIFEDAMAPKVASRDGETVQQHSVEEKIAADRYRRANQAARRGLGIRMVRMNPPGSV